MNTYINKVKVIAIMIMAVVMFAGCEKRENPTETPISTTVTVPVVNTTEGTPTSVPTEVPTATNTPEPTKAITLNHAKSFDSDREIPAEDLEYFARLEESHILPFLDGFCVDKKKADFLGGTQVREYELIYTCSKGDVRIVLKFNFKANKSYKTDVEEDTILFRNILVEGLYEGEWTVISEWQGVKGLEGHLN